jgi:hypothetical protein
VETAILILLGCAAVLGALILAAERRPIQDETNLVNDDDWNR